MQPKRPIDLASVPPGVQYFLEDDVTLRRSIERDVMSVFTGWGYREIDLPIFDSYDLFSLGMGEDVAARTYRFTARDGSTVALRPDLTSLVARTVATRLRAHARPLRLCYTGEVFRADEPRRGRQHEFHQLGVEQVGWASPASDVEILLIGLEALAVLGLDDARVTLGHAGFFRGIVERLGLDADRASRLRTLVDRRQSAAVATFLETLAPADDCAAFARLIGLAGGRDVIGAARELVTNTRSVAALDELAAVFGTLERLGLDARVCIDLGEVAGFDYYTGLMFSIYAPGWGLPLGGGGRYDALLAKFGTDEPAVGFSLSLDWLAGALVARGLDLARRKTREAEHLRVRPDLGPVFAEARRLRAAGRSVEIVADDGETQP